MSIRCHQSGFVILACVRVKCQKGDISSSYPLLPYFKPRRVYEIIILSHFELDKTYHVTPQDRQRQCCNILTVYTHNRSSERRLRGLRPFTNKILLSLILRPWTHHAFSTAFTLTASGIISSHSAVAVVCFLVGQWPVPWPTTVHINDHRRFAEKNDLIRFHFGRIRREFGDRWSVWTGGEVTESIRGFLVSSVLATHHCRAQILCNRAITV